MTSAAPSLETDPAVAARATGDLARHPGDGWVFAHPHPMGPDLVRAFHGLIRALVPPAPHVADVEVRIEQQVRRMLRYMPPYMPLGFKLLLRALDLAPLWSGHSLRRLRSLSPEAASALLAKLAESRVPGVADLVGAARTAVLAPYYDLDEVMAHVGYRPVPFMRGRVALRQRLLAGEPATPADHIGPFSDAVRAAVAAAPPDAAVPTPAATLGGAA